MPSTPARSSPVCIQLALSNIGGAVEAPEASSDASALILVSTNMWLTLKVSKEGNRGMMPANTCSTRSYMHQNCLTGDTGEKQLRRCSQLDALLDWASS